MSVADPARGGPVTPTGPLRFVRYAYPPNELGYCGPGDPEELLGLAATNDASDGLVALARRFEGAWPYLELIAAANGIADPLDERVVDAYWVGNALLGAVGPSMLLASVRDRFGPRAGRDLGALSAAVPLGALAHHSFHVFGVYPWLGLLRGGGHGAAGAAMTVLDRCRIRWGTVRSVDADMLTVTSRHLAFDGHRLHPGAERVEVVRRGRDGLHMLGQVRPGDVVSMHWDWACERLDAGALRRLRSCTARTLAAVNAAPVPGPAAVLDRLGA